MKTTKSKSTKSVDKAKKMAAEFAQIKLRKAAIKEEIDSLYGSEIETLNDREKVLEAELQAFGFANEKEFNKDGWCDLGDVIVKKGTKFHVLFSKNYDETAFAAAFPNLVKIELKAGEIKKLVSDGDKRKSLLKLGVDGKTEDIIKVELPKVA